MAHVTFIHGIANKPAPAELLRIWRETLANAAEPLPLGDLGVSSELVYWADLMYDKPDDNVAAHEGVLENTPAAVDGGGGATAPQPRTAEEAAFLEALRQHMSGLSDAQMAAAAGHAGAAAGHAGTRAAAVVPEEADHGRVPARRAPLPVRRRVRAARAPAGAHPEDHPRALHRQRLRQGGDAAARGGLAQHGHGDRLRLPQARRRLRRGRRLHHAGQPARPGRGAGQAAARLEPRRRLPQRQARARAGSTSSTGSTRSAASTRSWPTTTARAAPASSRTSRCRTTARGGIRSSSTCASRRWPARCGACCSWAEAPPWRMPTRSGKPHARRSNSCRAAPRRPRCRPRSRWSKSCATSATTS